MESRIEKIIARGRESGVGARVTRWAERHFNEDAQTDWLLVPIFAVVGLAVTILLVATVLPDALSALFEVDTTGWPAAAEGLWGIVWIIAIVAIIVVVLGAVVIRGRRG